MSTPGGSSDDAPRPRPDGPPGAEPLDPWAPEEAAPGAERWVASSGGLGPLPARTWTRGSTRVTVGGCCLPLPVGCLTVLATAAAVAVSWGRRPRG